MLKGEANGLVETHIGFESAIAFLALGNDEVPLPKELFMNVQVTVRTDPHAKASI